MGVTFNVGVGQLQGIIPFPIPIEKLKEALVGQTVSGMKIVTCVVWFGGKTPFCGVRVTPLTPVLLVDQGTLLRLSALLTTDVVHVQPLPAK